MPEDRHVRLQLGVLIRQKNTSQSLLWPVVAPHLAAMFVFVLKFLKSL